VVAAALIGLAGVAISTVLFESYGSVVFVGVPAVAGFAAAASAWTGQAPRLGRCLCTALMTTLIAGLFVIAMGLEGLMCMLMAAPIWAVGACIGGLLAYGILTYAHIPRRGFPLYAIALLVLPALMGAERIVAPEASLFRVATSIEINAPPQVVWRSVVAFPLLPPPSEALFRLGVAYPIHARIDGRGVGALRYCDFSTGSFVEPIEAWDEPRLLRFSVTSNPPPMRELSVYPNVHPPHLDGFLASERGQFELTELPGGRTRLTGTTWYRHNMSPEAYWQLWSDHIIHTIHRRVLLHVKQLAEHDAELAVDDCAPHEQGALPGLRRRFAERASRSTVTVVQRRHRDAAPCRPFDPAAQHRSNGPTYAGRVTTHAAPAALHRLRLHGPCLRVGLDPPAHVRLRWNDVRHHDRSGRVHGRFGPGLLPGRSAQRPAGRARPLVWPA
jgi:hypothetical protein